MRLSKEQMEALNDYRGSTPKPSDFEAFWQERIREADNTELHWEIRPSKIPDFPRTEYHELWFEGVHGEKMFAEYVRPVADQPVPLVLQFHGYPGRCRSFLEQSSFAGMGFALIAMDCPGQGGRSTDTGKYQGTTVSGHLIAGLDGPAKDMCYVRLYQNIRLLGRIVRRLPGIDLNRVYVNGASQGGGLGLVCCALNPDLISKASILYPFLSDFQKVWELGADEIAYEGLRYYTRWFDATGERTNEVFTKLGYVDVVSFASRVRCEVLFGTGLSDNICPPQTQMAVWNQLSCPKRHIFFPDFGHEEIQEFDDLLLNYYFEENKK